MTIDSRAPHPAREVARAVARAGWPVIPISTSTDDKQPLVKWKTDGGPDVCRSETDVTEKWPQSWPRWATICGVTGARDGRSLACLDADSAAAADIGRRLFPGYTRVRTGRPGGEHTWVAVPPYGAGLRWQGYLKPKLDWRAGDCIALLPGSLWHPRSSPGVVYRHIGGPALPDALDLPSHLVKPIAKKAPAARATRGPATRGPGPGPVDLSPRGAFEKFLAAADAHGALVDRGRSGNAMVQCPGHAHPNGNRKPALHVTAGPGGVGLHCFAHRCAVGEIRDAFGLSDADLFDDPEIEIEIVQ